MSDTTKSQTSGYDIFLGIVLIILGFITLGAQVFTSVASVYFFGWILLIGGIAQFFRSFFSGGWTNALIMIVGGILSFITGFIVITNPTLSVVTFTFIIALLLLFTGLYRMASSIIMMQPNWGWTFTGGILSLLLGVMVLSNWPASGLWVIGLFIGIELLITGFLLITNASVEPADELYTTQSSVMHGAKGGGAKKKKEEEL